MFSTLKSRILLGIYILIILSIPVGSYLVSQNQTYKSSATENKKIPVKSPKPLASPTTSTAARTLLSLSESESSSEASSSEESSSPTIANAFGPTLSLKASLEGRSPDHQATKLFVGIVEGELKSNPKFLLSFSVDLPQDGTYTNLSLAGLNSGTKYTALLKGKVQIATSSAFIMTPTVSHLNDGEAINMLTGDLNEDNVINSQDYNIALRALNTTAASSNWNENVDFNQDGLINLFDLALITKNLNQTGASGAWTSPLPTVASASASIAGQSPAIGGYWLWIPK